MLMSNDKSTSGDGKARRPRPPSPVPAAVVPPARPARSPGRSYSYAGVFVMLGLALGGLAWVGLWGLDWRVRRDLDRVGAYQVSFDQIDVAPPRGMGRDAFLAEVRFMSAQPETISLLDRSMPARLSAAFRAHPWVAEVKSVAVGTGGTVRVDLKFREPVLRIADGENGMERLVDPAGILLPRLEGRRDWPELVGETVGPPASPGQPWPSSVVRDGARLSGILVTGNSVSRVKSIRRIGTSWVLTTVYGDVTWGRCPGQETAGEPVAAEKLARLLAWLDAPGANSPPDLLQVR